MVYPNNVKDVQQAVRCCREFSIPLVPSGGGHSLMSELEVEAALSVFGSAIQILKTPLSLS